MSVKDLPDMQIQRLNSKQECNLRRQDKYEHACMHERGAFDTPPHFIYSQGTEVKCILHAVVPGLSG